MTYETAISLMLLGLLAIGLGSARIMAWSYDRRHDKTAKKPERPARSSQSTLDELIDRLTGHSKRAALDEALATARSNQSSVDEALAKLQASTSQMPNYMSPEFAAMMRANEGEAFPSGFYVMSIDPKIIEDMERHHPPQESRLTYPVNVIGEGKRVKTARGVVVSTVTRPAVGRYKPKSPRGQTVTSKK